MSILEKKEALISKSVTSRLSKRFLLFIGNFSELLLRRMGISFRLIVFFLILSLIPLSITGVVAINLSNSAMKENISLYSLQVLGQLNRITENNLRDIEKIRLEFVTSNEFKDYLNINKYNAYESFTIKNNLESVIISKTFTLSDQINSISFFPKNSNDVIGDSNLYVIDLKKYDYFKEFLEDTNRQSGWIFPRGNEQNLNEKLNVPIYIYKIKNFNSGEDVGTLAIIPKDEFFQKIYEDNNNVNGGFYVILNDENRIISSLNKQDIGKSIDSIINISKDFENINFSLDDEKDPVGILWEDISGKKMMVTYAFVKESNWKIVSVVPFSNLMEKADGIVKIIVWIGALCFIFAFIISAMVTRSVTQPINRVSQLIQMLKKGDFRKKLNVEYNDEISKFSRDFNNMLEEIRNIILATSSSAHDVVHSSQIITTNSSHAATAAEQVAIAIAEMAAGASNQSSESQNAKETINFLASNLNEVVENTAIVQNSAKETKNLSQNSIIVVNDLNQKAMETGKVTGTIISQINDLNTDLKQITNIVNVILAISEQTNLLSLNAAIEAARAGESGKGFAVVAEEVRKLAEQSKTASTSISSIISSILKKSNNVVEAANNAHITIEEQMKAVEKTDASFKSIVASTESIVEQIEKVNTLVRSINKLKEKAVNSIDNVADISQTAAASAEEISATTEEQIASASQLSELAKGLDEVARKLENNISKFKI